VGIVDEPVQNGVGQCRVADGVVPVLDPFGGYKMSGSLARDNGTEALAQYMQTKTIWITT
jgi:acyl-CoA reductase-like NAD-dependent aldehyde dehydrogenase